MINLENYGPEILEKTHNGNLTARITAVHRERYEIACKYGICFARLKTAVYYNGSMEPFPTVGDFVFIQYNETGDSQIIKTHERTSFFSRRDPTPGRGEQAVAANFDYVFIVQSLNNDFNIKRLERYVTLAWQSGAQPLIVLTKADLINDYSSHLYAIQEFAPHMETIAVSAKTEYNLEALRVLLTPGKTAVLLGSSGVGKSSLVNALAGREIMDINEIREDDSRGRHTTTHRQLIMLPSGAMIIDTPGMRELGMWDVSSGLGEAFTDVEAYFGKCRFSDCRHGAEPGCAIKEALESGELSEERWESYNRLKKEAKYSDNKSSALHEKHVQQKEIAKLNRKRMKGLHK